MEMEKQKVGKKEMNDMEKVEYKEYIIKRSDKTPLRIRGMMVAGDNTSEYGGRWEVVKIYRTIGGKYVLDTQHHSRREDERNIYEALVFDSAAALAEYVRGLDEVPTILANACEEAGIDIAEVIE